MDDHKIVELYWKRSEQAISETATKYGTYCYSIAYNILNSNEDAEESVNDTYNDAWNSMPPHRPSILSTFLGKITRRISIDRWRKYSAKNVAAVKCPWFWMNCTNVSLTTKVLNRNMKNNGCQK